MDLLFRSITIIPFHRSPTKTIGAMPHTIQGEARPIHSPIQKTIVKICVYHEFFQYFYTEIDPVKTPSKNTLLVGYLICIA